MNKKISTLMASLLFASAFTVNATVTAVEGDNVRLKFNSNYATIDKDNGFIASSPSATAPSAGEDGGNFEDVNRQIWKIAKLSKSSTGQELYQFVNKWTGEYLAIKLVSAPNVKAGKGESSESASKVTLDPTGNKEWAFDGTKLWAYDAVNDTTYYIDSNMKLVAKPGNDHSGTTSFAIETIPALSMPLNAKAFNQLMGLPGNNAKLNFNNGKDVTSTQTNQLKNVKWVADEKASGTDIFLTNGTTEGYKADLSGKEQRNLYLQVDTSYYDGKTPNYFKLDVDTLGIQPGESESKVIDRHPTNLAKFAATYFFGNDSIAIKATTLPAKGMSGGTAEQPAKFVSTSLEKQTLTEQKVEISTIIAKGVDKISESVEIHDALTVLEGKVSAWGATESGKFSAAYSEEISALDAALTDVDVAEGAFYQLVGDYLTAANTLEYRTEGFTVDGTTWSASVSNPITEEPTGDNAKKLKEAAGKWITNRSSITADGSFANSYWTFSDGGGGTWTGTEVAEGTTNALKMETLINLVAGEESATVSENVQGKLLAMACRTKGYSVDEFETGAKATAAEALPVVSGSVKFFTEDNEEDALFLQSAYGVYLATTASVANSQELSFAGLKFNQEGTLITIEGNGAIDAETVIGSLTTANAEGSGVNDADVAKLISLLRDLNYQAVVPAGQGQQNPYFFNVSDPATGASKITNFSSGSYPVVLRSLADVTVLTVNADGEDGYVLPLIQPYATSGGDATDIAGGAKIYNLQVKDASTLRAASTVNKYVISVPVIGGTGTTSWVADVDASNVYAQWVFIPGTSGFYSIVNRATEQVLYTGPVSKVKDADDKVVANTYVLGADTLKLASVELSTANVYEEGDDKVKYDYTGTYYAGIGEGTAVYKSFSINPVSPFLSQLAAQFNKDSVMVLGNADEAPVWYMEKGTATPYGVKIDGLPRLKKQLYRIYTTNADDKKIYVYETTGGGENVYAVSLLGSKHVHLNGDGTAVVGAANFEFRNIAEGQYQFINGTNKMTINATPAQPILEVSDVATQKNDLFMINKSEVEKYRKLTAEDGVLGNAKIYMENEPNRYLYENTANIVANNGTGLNFLGIYNTAELTKNAALYVDTAYVERKDVYMPQYMFALGVEEVEAQDAIACTYEHNHYDNAGNKVDAAHCSHATPATMGYKAGRYLVALTDSLPENGSKKTPVLYDNAIRLAFVNAIHRNAEDSLIIKDSKYTDNSKQQVAGKEKTWAAEDTLKIADNKLNMATFALLIKDQETKSFYLQNKEGFVRILNGVPVLTTKIEDAAVFNIEATTEEATANEAIEAAGVQVIGGKGAVTVQGAAGKVITVANVLGQTIANQVAASDNVTIAVPAGIVVVAVEGEATKVVVK